MGLIRAIDVAGGADTTEQGVLLWDALATELASNQHVTVSFAGITAATSSFVNVSFVRLLDIMTFDEVKKRVRVVDVSRQIADMVKTRLTKEASNLLSAA